MIVPECNDYLLIQHSSTDYTMNPLVIFETKLQISYEIEVMMEELECVLSDHQLYSSRCLIYGRQSSILEKLSKKLDFFFTRQNCPQISPKPIEVPVITFHFIKVGWLRFNKEYLQTLTRHVSC